MGKNGTERNYLEPTRRKVMETMLAFIIGFLLASMIALSIQNKGDKK